MILNVVCGFLRSLAIFVCINFLFHPFKASGLDLSQVSLNYIRDQIQEILTTQAQLDNLRFSNVAVNNAMI